MSKQHPGFKAVAAKIASKQGLPIKAADAILAKSSRNASPAAKAKNPALKKVAMPKSFEKMDKMADKKAGIKEGGKVDMKKDMKGKK